MAQAPVKFFLGYSPVELTDEQWTEIAYYSALPAEARKDIEMIIGGYRHFCADDAARPTAHQMRAHLKVLRKETSALRDKLKPSNMLDAPTSFMAHEAPGGLRRNTQLQREGIYLRENAVYALNALVGWLQMALDEVEDMPRGSARRAWNVGWLVAALDNARKGYTGENIGSYGSKDSRRARHSGSHRAIHAAAYQSAIVPHRQRHDLQSKEQSPRFFYAGDSSHPQSDRS